MRTNIRIKCADKYEAQKLCSMILVEGDTYIVSILNIIHNEMIIVLRDHSAHSIMLYSHMEAEKLAAHMQYVFDGAHYISDADIIDDDTVLIQFGSR